MNKKLQDRYESIIDELKLDEIKYFKIGITHDPEERERQYISDGYSCIYKIAVGDNASICQAESDLIKALLADNRVSSKCKNQSAALNLGLTQFADVLYVAVCIQFENLVSSVDIQLENILFVSGFPISL